MKYLRVKVGAQAARASDERRPSLEEETIQRTGASTVRKARVRALGQPAPTGVAGIARPFESTIEELTAAVEREVRKRPEALRLMTHPGVGPITAPAYVLIIGTPTRFPCGKQIGTYVGLIPCAESSARKQRLGHISKQDSSLLRFLFVEAGKRQHVSILTGDDGMFTWRCVSTKALPK